MPRAGAQPLRLGSADREPRTGDRGRVLLRATRVTKAFGGRVVLRNIDAAIREGEVVLLRGDNGSGKTTLLNILSGNLAPDRGTLEFLANGSREVFRFPRRWWEELNPADHYLPERVAQEGFGRSWQEARLFSTVRLVDNVAVAKPDHPGENPLNVLFRPRLVDTAEASSQSEATVLLETLGLNDRAASSADMISLGQTKRVAIARAVRAGGKVLLLDEPLAGLDAPGIQAVVRLLRRLVAEHGVTLVIVEHVWNAHHILEFATTLWTLRDGSLTARPLHSDDGGERDGGRNHAAACVRDLLAGMTCVGTHALARGANLTVYRASERAEAGGVFLEVRNLVVRRGRRTVVGDDPEVRTADAGLSFSLRKGELGVLEAPNGWGKTTLFEAVAGLLPTTRGEVRLLGENVTRWPPWERSRHGLCLLRADRCLFPSLTVDATFALAGAGEPPPCLLHLGRQPVRQLSGGEQQAVRLAQVGGSRGPVFLLDEPFSALDAAHVRETFDTIRRLLRDRGAAVLVATPVPGAHTADD